MPTARPTDSAMPVTKRRVSRSAVAAGATIKAGETTEYELGSDRHDYLVAAVGSVEVNGVRLDPRDGAAITGETSLRVTALNDAEVVLVDAA